MAVFIIEDSNCENSKNLSNCLTSKIVKNIKILTSNNHDLLKNRIFSHCLTHTIWKLW